MPEANCSWKWRCLYFPKYFHKWDTGDHRYRLMKILIQAPGSHLPETPDSGRGLQHRRFRLPCLYPGNAEMPRSTDKFWAPGYETGCNLHLAHCRQRDQLKQPHKADLIRYHQAEQRE